jgi:hypothetical protein
MVLTCDRSASALRQAALTVYMDHHVLRPTGFCCSSAVQCRSSAMSRSKPVTFAEGQLSHLGWYYDIESEGMPLRILVIGMETGRPDVGVTLTMRRQQILESAALPARQRNPHMIGVTHALRVLHGRTIGDDVAGEMLSLGPGHEDAHMFDAYAMANVRLCTSVRAGTMNSYPTAVMTRNCVRHLRETIRILEPTVCVVQSSAIPKMAEFTHPTAWGEDNWGRWSNMPYLQNVVIPTLTAARARLGLPTADSGHPELSVTRNTTP